MIHQSTADAGENRVQQYGLLMDFLAVAVELTKTFRQQFKHRQELCSQAGQKLDLAAKRVAEMETVAQQWRDSLVQLKSAAADSAGSAEAVVRTERDIELITCQIDRAKDLLASLQPYQERWTEAVVSLEGRIRCCQADCALTAAALIFGGERTESERDGLFRQWTDECLSLADAIITPGVSDYTLLVEAEVKEVEAAWIMANLPRDAHCIRSAVALRHVQRVPLLIDPHNIVERWIDALNAANENKPTYLHMAAPDYREQLAGALQLGTVVVVDITQTPLDPSIIPVVLRQTFSQGSTNYIKLGADLVEYAAEFQLYLRSQTTVDVDLQLRLCVTVIDLSLEEPGIYDTLVSALVNSERPDTEEKIQLVRQMSELRGQLDETEQSLLNILSHSEPDWIENDAVITSLLPAITQSKLLKEKVDVVIQTRERMEVQRQSFAPTALLAAHILSALWRIETLFPRLHFPLSSFADSVVACLEDGDGDTDDFDSNASPARKLAARLFNRKLKPGLNRLERLLVAFLLNCSVAISEKLCGPTFLQDLLAGRLKSSSSGHLLLTHQQTIDRGSSPEVPFSPEWAEFVDDVRQLAEEHGNKWRLASSIETLSQKLLNISCVKVELGDYMASLSDSSSSTPLLMVVEPGVDQLAILSRICREFDFPEDRVRFSSVAGLTSLNWAEVEDCVRRGNWLVLQGFSHLGGVINNMRLLLEHLATDNISAEFKLFILWEASATGHKLADDDDEPVAKVPPQLLLENCRSYYFEHVHSPEDCFQEMTRSFDFDRLINDSQRATEPDLYALKLKTAATLLILRVVLYDRWECLLPLADVWQTAHQMAHLVSLGHEWEPAVRRVATDNFSSAHVPSSRRKDFVQLVDQLVAAASADGCWGTARDALIGVWSHGTVTPATVTDFSVVAHLLTDAENERRRQVELSGQLWCSLMKGFA